MNSKEALKTLGNVGTKFVKSNKIGEPMIMYKVKELKKKEFNIIKESLKRLEHLEKENQELKEINEQLEGCNKEVSEFAYQIEMEREVLKEKVDELKQAIEILKECFEVVLCESDFPITELKWSIGFKVNNDGVWKSLTQEQYELLKQVFESVGDSDE